MKKYIYKLLCIFLLSINQCLSEAQDVYEMYKNIHYSKIGTYNNMQKQTGYCKMTGFNTISRSTSNGPSIFMDGRVKFGVGLSGYEFGNQNLKSIFNKTEGSLVCGMCINITSIDNLPIFNFELNNYETKNETNYLIAMVFDQCNDQICSDSFLDIDIYTDKIFSNSNTLNINWFAIDCPVNDNDNIEFLLCTTDTCNFNNTKYLMKKNFGELFNPFSFSIIIRNMKRPIINFYILYKNNYHELFYVSGIGYEWNLGLFDEEIMSFKLADMFNNIIFSNFSINHIFDLNPLDDYKGGVLLS